MRYWSIGAIAIVALSSGAHAQQTDPSKSINMAQLCDKLDGELSSGKALDPSEQPDYAKCVIYRQSQLQKEQIGIAPGFWAWVPPSAEKYYTGNGSKT